MKNGKDIKTYFEELEGLHLSEDSRDRIRDELSGYADFYAPTESGNEGVRGSDEVRSREEWAATDATPKNKLTTKRTKPMYAAITAIVLIMLGGGTALAAEGSVPGDFLYPVETQFNENIESAFAFGAESEAKLQSDLVAERLREAQELEARGELNAETSTTLRVELRESFTAARENIEELEANGNMKAATMIEAKLTGMLQANSRVLAEIDTEEESKDAKEVVDEIMSYARVSASGTTEAEAEVNADATLEVTASDVEELVTEAGAYLGEVKAELGNVKASLSAEAYAELESKLEIATEAHARAKTALSEEQINEAYAHVKSALRTTAAIESMTETSAELGIDLDGLLEVNGESNTSGEANVNGESTDTSSEANTNEQNEKQENENILEVNIQGEAEANTQNNTETQTGSENMLNVNANQEARIQTEAQGSAQLNL